MVVTDLLEKSICKYYEELNTQHLTLYGKINTEYIIQEESRLLDKI